MGLRVLFCASEAVPFAKTGGLADVAGALPKALAKLGHDVRLALPKYSVIGSERAESRQSGSALEVALGEKRVRVNLESSDAIPGVPTYLVDCPEYFERDTLYGEADDAERFALFCRAVLEFLRAGDWQPEVIHGNDWQTALLPVYLKTVYGGDPALSRIGTVHTIHNLAYQGIFDPSVLNAVGLDRSYLTTDRLEFYGQVNFLKGGLVFADLLNTVSKKYAEEIQTPEYGERLEGVLAKRRGSLFGILNGLDYGAWNPAADKLIEANYDADDLAPKAANKAGLQKRLNLPARPEVPFFGLVSRLAGQKGLDVLAETLPHLLRLDVQFALLGTGEPYYHELLSGMAKQQPDKMAVVLTFDNALAHQIYAGCDMFVMPSYYEPCGLGQMISLRYGTIPVVRETGGLADTITDFDPDTGEGNGFSFQDYASVALLGAMGRGILTMKSPGMWSRVVRNAFASNFSWERSALEYAELYQRAMSARRS
ncbi:MAG: glycogen synthase GlgA [Armatimonadota bacterium]|nr:glycogen synthase GlgA [Armatimonadota bacterium]